MNIFYLDDDLQKCAEYHCDKHVVKMITEQTQLLCSAYYFTKNIPNDIYKLTHSGHPCNVWSRESLSNWIWLKDMTLALYEEYKFRYNKQHKSGELAKLLPLPNLIDIGITERLQAMPDVYKNKNCITAYREYYKNDKKHLLKCTKRDLPYWLR